jgi:hypothetical protein
VATLNDGPVPLPKIGKCKRCGRTLTEHNSIIYELGPICRTKMGIKITRIRIKKENLTIKKPRVHKFKFSEDNDTLPEFNLENWFLEDEKI